MSSPVSPPANPYAGLPPRAFWRTGVAEPGLFGLKDLWASKWQLPSDARFSTFGSCFAQHISRALVARGMNWLNAEPAPMRTPPKLAEAYNYGVFSARTGNIYTAAQLLTHVRMAAGEADPAALEVWADGPGLRDSIRPAIEPVAFADAADLGLSRASMVRAFRRSITDAEVFVFTLGLTEGWENAATGQVYPLCPGTLAGQFDPAAHVFRNHRYPAILADLQAAFALMWAINPGLRVLLTVSPVPLTATAAGGHVLAATMYSKSVLRAVAGDLAADDARIDYFPSYEIISGAPTRSAFYEPNLRSVAHQGVDFVMSHFFAGLDVSAPPVHGADPAAADRMKALRAEMAAEELVCEEMTLEGFNAA
ncbi:GSCFA domain-containing protein [Paracoccaceae bacterium Fryx2]|nr:GSCFA domain-containing protein [Paracoccaceae bacterium Fryx2]